MTSAKAVLVTGGADGIGWAIARRFAGEGYRVAIADLRGDAAVARARELGEGHIAITADMADEGQVVSMVAKAQAAFGRIDVLVNNAGIADSIEPTTQQSADHFRKLLDIHLTGSFVASRDVAKLMASQGGGAIVNLSSMAGLIGLPRRNAYSAAKAGLAAMTRAMAAEWGRRGIRVNSIAPGYVATDLVQRLSQEGKLDTGAIERRTPLGRLAKPEEIADAAFFLASPQASFITGIVLTVDGGWVAFGLAGDAPE